NTTLLDISRMLTDTEFRKETLTYCKDVTVLQFWKKEFGSWSDKQVTESVAPVLNKVGAFTANPIVRNIIGQPKSSFNIRKIMDEGKILVVNLSKGLIGEDNAGLLGSFLVTKVQLAAMSRSDIENVEDRRPFYLYVDEFQNFATDSFSVILSEARKYGLNLTVANQYTSQMTDSVRDAVFGNVGTTISFRVSADDAPVLAKQFEPVFEAQDLLNLNNRHFVISMIINGEKVPAFSATTLSIPKPPHDITPQIIEYSRQTYARPREEVEKDISANIAAADKFKKELSDSGRAAGERGSQNQGNNSSKPVFKFQPTLQQEFRKQKISPNAAQGEDENAGNGLRNLGKLFAEKAATISPNIKTEASEEESKADTSVSDEAAKRPIISSGNGNKNSRHNNNRNRNKNHK
ncbi:MAG: type IV secretory system conjugative DNA transfer family protein, partial [Candidatus Saccharibacteria bacterium]|nr:type IV secretory system conjugative DNA transfer family protein [Candidatus Saccharibacteria bacterium]